MYCDSVAIWAFMLVIPLARGQEGSTKEAMPHAQCGDSVVYFHRDTSVTIYACDGSLKEVERRVKDARKHPWANGAFISDVGAFKSEGVDEFDKSLRQGLGLIPPCMGQVGLGIDCIIRRG